MNIQHSGDPQFEIINFLYQYKDDNKFYKLEDHLLNIGSKKEKYLWIYQLRDKALIATDSEFYYNDVEDSIGGDLIHPDEIRARILPKGVVAVENLLRNAG